MKKKLLNWCLILSMVLTLLPVPAGAAEDSLTGMEYLPAEAAQCTCGAQPDENGVILHEEGCPCAVSGTTLETEGTTPEPEGTTPETEGTTPETEGTTPETEGTTPETEGTTPETEGTTPEAEEPAQEIEEEEEEIPEALTAPSLTVSPLDEENSSDMVLTVEGEWDSYAWESCNLGFWYEWEEYGPSLILSKEEFTSRGFRCVVTRGEQSVTSEEFAYDPSVLEIPRLMANTFSSGTLVDGSDYIRYYQSGNRFDIQGVDNEETFQTTYRDKGYRTAISVNGGSKVDIPYQMGEASVGGSLTAQTTLDLAYGGRYVKITYTVKNNGSATQEFQIGSSADVMIDNNDRAEVKPTGTGLSMDGKPLNDYKFSLVAPDCDTLWFGNYYKAYENMFNNQDTLRSYSGDSGMAWSWSGIIAPGQTWSRYVLIGAGDLPEAPQAPTLDIQTNTTWKVGKTVSITGTVFGSPAPDSVTVSIGGWEYTADVQPDGSFSIEIEVPELPEGETAFTYWSTTEEGGISDIKSQSVTIVPKPYVRLTTDSVSVMEDDADFDETKLKSYIQASYGTVTISPQSVSTDIPGEYSVVYTATDGIDTEEATLKVTVRTRPAALTAATVTDQGENFSLSATMEYTGGLTFTETGFVYGALQNPTLSMNDGQITTGSIVNSKGGSMTASVDKDQLTYGISYYARAYAKTSDGTVIYSAQSSSFGIGNPDYGTFSVAYTKTEGNTSTFTITRNGTDGEQTVYYRTVNGSAVGETHFAHNAGSVTFQDGETVKTVTVMEYGVSSAYDNNAATAYANANRSYSLEIYRVTGGATIAGGTAVREMAKDTNKTIDRGLFNTYQTNVNPSGETDRGDYDGTGMGWTDGKEGDNAKVTISFGTGNFKDYMNAVAQNVQYKVSFQAKEVNDGYQHIQIVPGSGIDLGYYPYQGSWNGSMTKVVYAATFEHGGDTKNTDYKTYTFPNANGSVPNLKVEKWKDSSYNGNGCVLLPVDTTQLTVGFGASGDDKDKWTTKDVTHYIKYLDTKEPTLLGVAPMAGGSYLPGDSVTVALVFDEIVDSANSNLSNVSIKTNWGTLAYAGGADTNVLYFTGTVSDTASGTLTVNSINNASNIKDMADDTGTGTSDTVSGGNSGAQLGNGANAPTVNVSAITNTNGTLTAAITATNAGKLEYVWSTETDISNVVGWQMLTDTANATVSTRQTSDTWYLYARATNADGVSVYGSSSINLDEGGEPVQLPSLTVTADNDAWAASRMVNIEKSPSTATVKVKTPDGTETAVTGDSYRATENGIYTFTLTSGEETITQAVTVSKIDNIAPTVEISDLDNTAHIENVTLTVRVYDAQSGIQTVTGQWQDENGAITTATLTSTGEDGVYQTTTPGAGSWTLHVTAVDAVGNTASDTSNTYTVNLSEPTITVENKGDSSNGVTYAYTITKGGSDIVSVQLPDGFELEEGVSLPADRVSGSLTFRESGTYTIIVRDEAGHVVTSDPMTVEIQRDLMAPEVRLSPSAFHTTETLTVNVSVVEMGSTPAVTVNGSTIALTEEETGIYSGSFEINAAGTYTVTAKDAAGNEGTDSITVHSVTFETEGQTFSTQLVVAGNNAVDPGIPQRTGYIFEGWYKDGTAWDFASSVEDNITLMAQWTAEAAAAPVVTKGNDVTQTYGTENGTISVEVTKAEGYTYSYQWYSNSVNSADGGTLVSGATASSYTIPEGTMVGDHYYYCVVTAQRQDNQETAQTASGVITVTIEKAAQTAPGEKEGYTIDYQKETISILDGYEIYTQQTGGTKLTDGAKITPGDTLYIRRTEGDVLAPSPWTAITIPDRPAAPAGITKTDETIQKKGDGTVSGILEGMEYRVDGGEWESGPATLTNLPAGTVVAVRYRATADQFYSEETTVTILVGTGTLTVAFNAAGGAEVEDVKVSVYGATITAPETSRTGYTLDGWYLNGEKWDFESNTVTEDMTLTAKWDLVSYTITYDLDGGSLAEGESNPTSYTVETETFSLYPPTKTGYVFAGWTEGNETEPQETVTVSKGTTGNKSYTAQWKLAEFAATVTADKTSAAYGGEPITLTAAHNHTADGVTYTYQWYKDDSTAPIANESNSTLVLSKVSQSGRYHAVITANDGVQEKESASNEVTVAIEEKTITATWSGLEQVYGEKEPVTAALSGVETGDTVTVRIDGVLESAGEHTVTAVLEGADKDNYTLKNNTATLKIQKKPVVITVTDNVVTADNITLPTINAPGLSTSDYEVIYKDKDGNKVSSPTEPGSYEVWVTFPDDSNYRHPDGSSEKQVGSFLISEIPPVLYTVNFTEAGGSIAGMQSVGGSTLTLPECKFTKEDALFTGWLYNGKLYQPGDTFTMPYGNVTFTAQWQKVFAVTGTVTEKTDGIDTPEVSGAVVSLWLGANKISEVTTDKDGSFQFGKLVPGIYNLVVTKDERTVTKKVEISSEDKTCEAVLPKGATNSIVEVAPGSPDMVVGNLDRVFEKPDTNVYTEKDEATVIAGGKVEITFAAETKQQEDVSVADDMEKIEAEKNSRDILGLVMDYTLEKEVLDEKGTEITSITISQSNVLLEVLLPLPADMQGKNSYSVYRVHEGTAQALTTTPSADLGEYFTVNSDKTVLTLYVKCFSTYAIGYQEKPKKHDDSEEAVLQTEDTLVIEQTEHGSVSVGPEKPQKGDVVTITPAPEEGYITEKVIVTGPDGETIEVVSHEDGTYTFVQPDGKATITVTFQKMAETPECPRDESCPMADFSDLDRDAWYHDGIHYCLEEGLMVGIGENTFAPNGTSTRAMIVAILWRMEGSPEAGASINYDDVKTGDWYAEAVRWADEEDVVAGYGNGLFGPNDPITRQQLAAILWRYMGSPVSDGSLSAFVDQKEISGWALPAMTWAVEQGLMVGDDGNRLNPQGQATRAEAATMLMHFCAYREK